MSIKSNVSGLLEVQKSVNVYLNELQNINMKIRQVLTTYANGKYLKGDEVVGWLGEIYASKLLNGKLVDDTNQHDFETEDGCRISVKARKGNNDGWKTSGIIYRKDGKLDPTHLMFIHFKDDYSIDRIWVYSWEYLLKENRLKEKIVGDDNRGWIFNVRDKKDKEFIIPIN